MDRLMPIDLQRPQLRKSIRGYDVRAVDALLAEAASSLAHAIDEAAILREQVARDADQLARFRAEEGVIKEALVLAQRTADETRAAAQREADAIREEARVAAAAERQEMQRTADDLRWEIERLRQDRVRFQEDFRAMLERYQRDIGPAPVLQLVDGQRAAG